MIPHKMGLPKAQLFSWGSLIPPKVHFWGSEGNEMSKLLPLQLQLTRLKEDFISRMLS